MSMLERSKETRYVLANHGHMQGGEYSIPIAFFLLTIKDSTVLISCGLQDIVEYIALFLLLVGAIHSFCSNRMARRRQSVVFFFCIVILFSVGLIPQDLNLQKKLVLILSGIMLAILAIFPNSQIKKYVVIKTIAQAIVCGCVVTTLLALVANRVVFEPVNGGGLFELAFTAGQQTKNYVAYEAFAAIIAMSLYMGSKEVKRSVIDYFFLGLAIGIMIFANSKSVYLILIIFFGIKYICGCRAYYRTPLVLGVVIILFAVVFSGVLFDVLLQSPTYMIRVTGVTNYLQMYSSDSYHMFFGNAEMAFRDSGYNYVQNIRSVTGWDGTAEIAWLDILVKNGLFGVLAYVLIFGRYLIAAVKINSNYQRSFVVALLVMFFATTFIESYVCTLHTLFGPFCYILLASLTSSQTQIDETCEISSQR